MASAAGSRREEPRSARKRRAIMEAATALFLRQGYQGTSMDQVAELAAVSKQTVYKHFADKYQLCRAIVLDAAGTVDSFGAALAVLHETKDLEKDLGELARWYISSVTQPRVLQLRRLVIAEAMHFPELGRAYYEQVPKRSIDALAACLQRLAERGLLQIAEPQLAACHFAYLVLSIPLDRAMVCGEDAPFAPAELEHVADAAVRVFLAAYGKT
jgi:TetR/AcrR family transcriptional regulator, mexJK operon transcriptional repressor